METNHNLQIHIETDEVDSSKKQVRSLKKWVESADFEEEIELWQARKPLAPDEAGGDWLTILGVALSSPLVHEFGKSIWAWYRQKSRQQADLTLTLTTRNGNTIRIESNATIDEATFVSQLVKVMELRDENTEQKEVTANFLTMKNAVAEAIGKNKTTLAFAHLETYLNANPAPEILKTLLIRKAEFAALQQEINRGIIQREDKLIARNRIHLVLQDLVTQLELEQV